MTANEETWQGRWGWVSQLRDPEAEVDRSHFWRRTGVIGESVFGLPPSFVFALSDSGVLTKINWAVGSNIDVFEDEDVTGPERLRAIAGLLSEAEWSIENVEIATGLAMFVEQAAEADLTLNFWF